MIVFFFFFSRQVFILLKDTAKPNGRSPNTKAHNTKRASKQNKRNRKPTRLHRPKREGVMSAAFTRTAPTQQPPENNPSIHHASPEPIDSSPSSPRTPNLPGPPNVGEDQSIPRSHPPEFNTRTKKEASLKQQPLLRIASIVLRRETHPTNLNPT